MHALRWLLKSSITDTLVQTTSGVGGCPGYHGMLNTILSLYTAEAHDTVQDKIKLKFSSQKPLSLKHAVRCKDCQF